MNDSNFTNLNPQTPIFMAFLGGITFTALTLFIQSANTLKFANILIPFTAVNSFLFILCTLGSMKGVVHKDFQKMIFIFSNVGIYGLIITIPVAILSFNYYGALIVLIVEISSVAIFNIMGFKNRSLPTNTN